MTGYNPSLTTEWADGEYTFRLRTGEILKLQDAAAPDGPWAAHRQLIAGTCSWKLVRETIRFGLIGGTKSPVEAERLLKTWVDEGRPDDSRLLALRILDAWIAGAEAAPKKADAPEGQAAA